jgi:putative SOS response-associated peptidase YedK
MCGRVALFTPPVRLARLLDAALAAGIDPEGTPSWNVGPTQGLYGLTEVDGARVLDHYRWGLIPSWAKDVSIGSRLFNARAETVAEKPSFRSAFKRRPCVIPVDGFYEWERRPGHPTRVHYFTRTDGAPMLFAGLYEHWRGDGMPADAAPVQTCTIITTEPNDDIDEVHNRMPVVLELGDVETWIDVERHEPDERHLLLRPAPGATLTHVVVDAKVGSIRNDGPDLIAPLEPDALF